MQQHLALLMAASRVGVSAAPATTLAAPAPASLPALFPMLHLPQQPQQSQQLPMAMQLVPQQQQQHVPAVRPKKRCKAPGCTKVFSSSGGLSYHMRREHNPQTRNHMFPCTVRGCLKRFASKQGLHYHLSHHARKRPKTIPCPDPTCTKTFMTTAGRRYHLRYGKHEYADPAALAAAAAAATVGASGLPAEPELDDEEVDLEEHAHAHAPHFKAELADEHEEGLDFDLDGEEPEGEGEDELSPLDDARPAAGAVVPQVRIPLAPLPAAAKPPSIHNILRASKPEPQQPDLYLPQLDMCMDNFPAAHMFAALQQQQQQQQQHGKFADFYFPAAAFAPAACVPQCGDADAVVPDAPTSAATSLDEVESGNAGFLPPLTPFLNLVGHHADLAALCGGASDAATSAAPAAGFGASASVFFGDAFPGAK